MAEQPNVGTYHDRFGNWWVQNKDDGTMVHENPFKTEDEAKKFMGEYMKKQGMPPAASPQVPGAGTQKGEKNWMDQYLK